MKQMVMRKSIILRLVYFLIISFAITSDKDCDNLAKELGFDDKDFFDNYILNDSSL